MGKGRIARSMAVVFVVGLFWSMVSAVPAIAAPCGDGDRDTAESVYLFDTDGWPWDLDDQGEVDDGKNDAFDSYFEIDVGGSDYPSAADNACAAEEGGREIVYPEVPLGGLQVSRKTFVPSAGEGFARFLTILRNAGAAPVSTTYELGAGGDLGSDGSTDIEITSSGDQAATTADRWAITDDAPLPTDELDGDPVVLTMWDGLLPGAAQTAATVDFMDTDDSPVFTYPVTVPPGGTFVFLHVVAQRASHAPASALVARLSSGAPDVFAGMSAAELAQLRNFALPTCRSKTATMFGTSSDDALTGTSGNDVVLAGGGNDNLTTSGGKDTVCAGDGNDKVNAGGGKDVILGQGGNDRMNGGPGTDTCKGGPGTDKAKACEKGKA